MPETNRYTMHCAECHTTVGLTMVAHHVRGKMIGWLFVCETCWPIMSAAVLSRRPGAYPIPSNRRCHICGGTDCSRMRTDDMDYDIDYY